MTIEQIEAVILDNAKNGRFSYEGLSSAEIGQWNRRCMFGENDEAFPDQDEWSSWVD